MRAPRTKAAVAWLRAELASTSTRTFVVWPSTVLVEQAIAGRRLRWRLLPYAGRAACCTGGRAPVASAPAARAGVSVPPERLVTAGVYRLTRNPMYLGHLVHMAGMAAGTRSAFALAILAAHVPWFDRRAARDEQRLECLFGDECCRYRAMVPRWLPSACALAGVVGSRT